MIKKAFCGDCGSEDVYTHHLKLYCNQCGSGNIRDKLIEDLSKQELINKVKELEKGVKQ